MDIDQLLDGMARVTRFNRGDMSVVIRKCNPGGLTAHQTVNVAAVEGGIDWESRKIILVPEFPLAELTTEDVDALRKSAKEGQSWHAYKQWEAQQKRISDLEKQVKELTNGKGATA